MFLRYSLYRGFGFLTLLSGQKKGISRASRAVANHRWNISGPMKESDYLKRRCVPAIYDQVGADWPEADGTIGEIGAGVSFSRPNRKLLEGVKKFVRHAIGCARVVRSDEIPNVLKVVERFRREGIFGHPAYPFLVRRKRVRACAPGIPWPRSSCSMPRSIF